MPHAGTEETSARSFNGELLMHRVHQLERWRDEMSAALARQVETQHQLLLLDKESQIERREFRAALERCFTTARSIDDKRELLTGRVENIEQALPMLRMTSRWVMAGVLAAASSAVASGGLLYLVWRVLLVPSGG